MDGRVVFLTGATGFIGERVARRLAADGWQLRCLVRSPSAPAAQGLAALGAELIPGDVVDDAALDRGLRGAALAYHIAAVYDIGVVDEGRLETTNVDGTRAFLRALERAGTARAVYVSSTVALGPVPPGEHGDAQPPFAGPHPSIYHRTKTEAHRLALEAQRRGLPLVIACPAYVYGPGDQGPAGRLIEDLLRRRVPTLVSDPAWYSYVHVDDVADALAALAVRGATTGVYVLGGENERFDRFIARITKLAGVFTPRPITPRAVARALGRVLDVITRRTGRRFAISVEGANVASGAHYTFGHARARADLDFAPRSLDEGLPGTVKSFQAARRVRRQRSAGR